MPRKKKADPSSPTATDSVASTKYPATRKNLPPAGLEAQVTLQETARLRYEYNPHLPPVLRSAIDAGEADRLPELLATARQRALSAEEANILADALRRHELWLEWSGKREKPWFEVEPVALHVHERVSTHAILRVLAREDVALIRPDVAMGDLLKTQPGSQLFTVFSAPRVKGPTKQADAGFTVEVEGMDVHDPVSNTLFPTDNERIAAWFLDTDYDGRTFCICQAFSPDRSKWAKPAKALGETDVIEEDALEALSGLRSLPFPRPGRLGKGGGWRVAVKVIDPRGSEGLRVVTVKK